MSKKKPRKIQPGDFVTFVIPKKVDPAIIEYLNDTSKTRNKKIIEAIEFYINYETILRDIKEELLKEIKNIIEKNLVEEKTEIKEKVVKDKDKKIDDFIYNVFNKMKSLRE